MPALYQAIITKKGLNLRSKAEAGKYGIEFTKAVTGSGVYDTDENLQEKNDLKNPMQEFGFSKREYVDDATSMLQVIVTNADLEEGYYVREIGVFAMDPDEGEILYSLSLAVDNKWDYLPEHEWGAAMIELEIDTAVSNAEKVIITAKMDALASADDLNSLREPEFKDYSISEEAVPDVEESLQMIRPGKHLKLILQYIKAVLMGLLELGKKLDTGENIVEFEDYSENGNDIPDPEEAIGQVVSGKTEKVFKQYVKASLKGLLNLAQRALSIATGKNQARVFATVEALDAWLAVPTNVAQLNVGDNFYITAVDVPDYWWDGTQKQKLETQKIDLAAYDQRIAANSSSINELNNKYNSFERAKSTIINSALGKALSMTVTTTLDTVASKISSIVNRGAWNGSIGNSGGSVTIPSGYHNGSGKVTGPTLAGLVGSNVNLDSGARMLSGYTAYGVNGTKHSGSIVNRSTTIQTVVSDTSDNNKSIYWINGTNLWIIPAVGYWGNWDWYSSRIQITASTLGVNAAKILNDTTICGVTGTVARKTSGSTAITEGGKYGFSASNGFWMYIPANAYYTTEHWLNVPYAQASALLGGTAASWTCPYMSSTTGIHAKFPSTIFSETPNRACYIIAMSFIHEDSQTGVSVSGGSQKYRWQGKVALDKSASCGYGTIIVQYVPAGTKVTVTAASITVNYDVSGDYCVVKGTI